MRRMQYWFWIFRGFYDDACIYLLYLKYRIPNTCIILPIQRFVDTSVILVLAIGTGFYDTCVIFTYVQY